MNTQSLVTSAGADSPLARAADELMERLAASDQVDVESLLTDYPEHEAELRRLLPAMMTLKCFGNAATAPATSAAPAGVALGDFRLLRELGRGGMGVVYEAEQLSLTRRVAVKVLPFAGVLDERHLLRFKHEATAAAMLKHPHIVSVYSIGCERGVHYYAMELIDGQTLAELIGRRRSQESGAGSQELGVRSQEPGARSGERNSETLRALRDSTVRRADFFAAVAQLGIQAAEALEHAHQHGVVHRDIKPSNLMVDARGHLWITDFGLAMATGDASLTMTGDLVGTLRYMSPEQAESRYSILDHRTDIYSLGATLYELATDRPVVTGQERAEILREIAEKDPASARKLTPGMPVDLETILLKCLNKEPSARYDSALALAEDLRRFLEEKPVVARRPSVWDRAKSWGRRHQGAVFIAIAILAATAVGTTIAALLIAQAQRETEAARLKVEASNRLARQAVDDMYTGFAKQWLAEQPQLTKVQASFLDKAASFYEALAAQSPADDATEYEMAKVLLDVALIRQRMGDAPRAKVATERSLAMADRLQERDPATKKYRNLAASGWNMLGAILLDQGDRAAAETACQTAVDEFELLVRSDPSHEGWRFNLATTRQDLGSMCFHAGKPREGYIHLQNAAEGYRALVHDYPEKSGYGDDLARALINLASTACGIRELEEGAAAYDEAIELLNGRVVRGEAEAETRSLLAGVLYTSVQFLGPNGKLTKDEALARLNRCVEMQQALVTEFPDIPVYQSRLKSSRNMLSLLTTQPSESATPIHGSGE